MFTAMFNTSNILSLSLSKSFEDRRSTFGHNFQSIEVLGSDMEPCCQMKYTVTTITLTEKENFAEQLQHIATNKHVRVSPHRTCHTALNWVCQAFSTSLPTTSGKQHVLSDHTNSAFRGGIHYYIATQFIQASVGYTVYTVVYSIPYDKMHAL